MAKSNRFRIQHGVFGIFTALLLQAGVSLPAFAQEVHRFQINTTDAATAIHEFGNQSGVQILASAEALRGKRLNEVSGDLSTDDGLQRLLADTGLSHRYVGERAVALVSDSAAPGSDSSRAPSAPYAFNNPDPGTAEKKSFWSRFRLAQVGSSENSSSSDQKTSENSSQSSQKRIELDEIVVGIPEILVIGSKSLNTDIRRTRDDIQPYVVFNRETIAQSGLANLDEFFKQRLTANTVAIGNPGTFGGVNLRGLGANQTLILVDGHRVAPQLSGLSGFLIQPDVNGIPLAAIERVEVLPTTASGIYGGGATGGVINIILRRDYEGFELKLTYDNSFDTDNAIRRLDFSSGFLLEGGRTSVLLVGSYADGTRLLTRDRDFVRRARADIVQNLGGPANIENTALAPLGATVNIRSVSGGPLFGPGTSNITFLPPGYTRAAGLGPLQVNAGQYNLELADTAQASGFSGGGAQLGIGFVPTVESIGVTIRREFAPKVQGFLDAAATNNRLAGSTGTTLSSSIFTIPASAPTNPFGQAVRVTVPLSVTDSSTVFDLFGRRMVAGLIFGLPREWQSGLDYSWSRTRFLLEGARGLSSAATTAVTTGTLDVFLDPAAMDFSPYVTRGSVTEPYRMTTHAGVWRVSGPLLELPAGPLKLTGLLEYRREEIGEGSTNSFPTAQTVFSPARWQTISGAYLEVLAPLVSARNAFSGVQELETQLAVRFDDYTLNGARNVTIPIGTQVPPDSVVRARTGGDAVSPTIGFKYSPVAGTALRASYGTGYLPPNLYQLTPNASQVAPAGIVSDPLRGNTPSPAGVTITGGGSPLLTPEESESWSVGGILTPSFVPGFRLSVDYTEIRKRDNIATLTAQQTVDNEAFLPGRITRGPVTGFTCTPICPITGIDQSSVNMSRALVTMYDAALDYQHPTATWGSFVFQAAATRYTHFKTQLAPSTSVLESAGTAGVVSNSIPLKLKANAGVTWKYGRWTAGWNARYSDSYVVVHPSVSTSATTYLRQGSNHVSGQTYHDLFAAYRTADAAPQRWLENAELKVGIRNVFDKEPPLDVTNSSNLSSALGDHRLRTYNIALTMNF